MTRPGFCRAPETGRLPVTGRGPGSDPDLAHVGGRDAQLFQRGVSRHTVLNHGGTGRTRSGEIGDNSTDDTEQTRHFLGPLLAV